MILAVASDQRSAFSRQLWAISGLTAFIQKLNADG